MCGKPCVGTKFCVLSFGFALGIAKGLFFMILAWSSAGFGYGSEMITLLASVYHGYAATFVGGIIGAVWGLVDGFIFGIILAGLYNCFVCACCKKSGTATPEIK